ncbi:hypothetical protein ACHAXR_005308 [Thalassiosira sp. AJA248-18]
MLSFRGFGLSLACTYANRLIWKNRLRCQIS